MGSKRCLLEDACSPSLPQDPGPPLWQKSDPLCVCVCVCMHVRVYVCAHVHMYMCVCMCACMCVCVCVGSPALRRLEMGSDQFLYLSTTDSFFGPGNPFVVRPHPIHFRTSFSTIFGLNSLGTSSSLLVTTMENVSRHHHMSFGGQNCSWLRTTGLRRWGSVGAYPQVPGWAKVRWQEWAWSERRSSCPRWGSGGLWGLSTEGKPLWFS